MNEKSIVKIAMRATRKNQVKKGVTIQDSADFGICRYVTVNRAIFRVMHDRHGYDVSIVPFVGY